MRPWFVSYIASKNGELKVGWVVADVEGKITNGAAVMNLQNSIELEKDYDPASVVLLNFFRLEE